MARLTPDLNRALALVAQRRPRAHLSNVLNLFLLVTDVAARDEAVGEVLEPATADLRSFPMTASDPFAEELTGSMDAILAEAGVIALGMRDDAVDVRHVLLAMLNGESPVAVALLESYGVDVGRLRRVLAGTPSLEARRQRPHRQSGRFDNKAERVLVEPLQTTLTVGLHTSARGMRVSVELLGLKRSGMVVEWRATKDDDVVFSHPDVTIIDDVGTAYTVIPGEFFGTPRQARGTLIVTRKPPAIAKRLRIVFNLFRISGGARELGLVSEELKGPWIVDVLLPSQPT